MFAVSDETPHRSKRNLPSTAQRRRFRIELRGQVDPGWVAACEPTSFSGSAGVTTLEVLADQAALRGVLNRLWDLNLDVLSVVEIGGPAARSGGY